MKCAQTGADQVRAARLRSPDPATAAAADRRKVLCLYSSLSSRFSLTRIATIHLFDSCIKIIRLAHSTLGQFANAFSFQPVGPVNGSLLDQLTGFRLRVYINLFYSTLAIARFSNVLCSSHCRRIRVYHLLTNCCLIGDQPWARFQLVDVLRCIFRLKCFWFIFKSGCADVVAVVHFAHREILLC